MDDKIKKEEVIEELKTLIDMAEEYRAEIDAYCEFMKGMFLSASSLN